MMKNSWITALPCVSLLLSACGGGASSSNTAVPPPTTTVALSASPASVMGGATATLTWSSTNATACLASGGWNGTLAASGSQVTGALSATTVYSLACTGIGATSTPASQTVTVLPAPTVALAAAPSAIQSGAASNLTWQSSNATTCTAAGGSFAGTQAAAGSQSTGALAVSTLYSITCSGVGGTSNLASITVGVTAPTVSVTPRAAGIALTQTQRFTATVAGGVAPSWAVDAVAGGNATVGTITSTGLYTAGTAAGLHTVLASSGGGSGTATVAVTDSPGVLTYHNDNARDGANLQEYALTPANVRAGSFGKLKSCIVDGAIYGQPLWVPNVTIGSAKHNVVFVATQHDSLYAFDADTTSCAALWQVSLLDTDHGGAAGETSVPSAQVGTGYGNLLPEVGVLGTPVIDPGSGILYAVSTSIDAPQTLFYQRLHAIDFTTGAEKVPPVTVLASVAGAASGGTTILFSPRQEAQRAGLGLVNGVVYVTWGSHEDVTPYFGWIMGYRITSGAWLQTAVLNTATHTGKAGIWMSGGAPAADTGGNLYLVTGNGIFDVPNLDYGDSLLKLTGGLTVADYYTPADQDNDNLADADFGAGGAAVLADLSASSGPAHLLICGGKSGNFYVVNRDSPGGYDLGATRAVQVVFAGGALYATGSFWNNHYYIGRSNGGISAFTLNPSTSLFGSSPSSSTPAGTVFGIRGGTPSLTAAGMANGILWALDSTQFCTRGALSCGPVVLHAYDAANLGTELWNSAANAVDAAGYAVKFTVPTIANGKVYVGTRGNNIGGTFGSTSASGELDVYALLP